MNNKELTTAWDDYRRAMNSLNEKPMFRKFGKSKTMVIKRVPLPEKEKLFLEMHKAVDTMRGSDEKLVLKFLVKTAEETKSAREIDKIYRDVALSTMRA